MEKLIEILKEFDIDNIGALIGRPFQVLCKR